MIRVFAYEGLAITLRREKREFSTDYLATTSTSVDGIGLDTLNLAW